MHYELVIVGGGAGGLELASRLGRKYGRKEGKEKILLIDRSIVHVWKPTLHEVAADTLNPQQEGLLYTMLAQRNHFSFRLGAVDALDPQARTLSIDEVRDDEGNLLIPRSRISFSQCVLALGSGSNSFGTQGFEHAFVLESIEQAQYFQKHLFGRFLQTAYGQRRNLAVAIVGAGATGVELAAEMIEAYQEIHQIISASNRFRMEIHLIEASPRILSALDEGMSSHAAEILRRKDVQIHTGAQVAQITDEAVICADGKVIPADMVMWAAGIKAASSNRNFGLDTNAINQFIIDTQLRTSAPHIHALGDCAALEIDGLRIPATAQAAHQQARFLARLLWAREKEKPFHEHFRYVDSGALVTLGNNKGVGNINSGKSGRSFFVRGIMAKYAHMSLHLMHHFTVLGFWRTALLALARLAQKRVSGRLKLH